MVSAIVQLARAIGVPVVAEGVETASELASIIELGCRYAQGYLLGRPVPADTAIAMITSGMHRRPLLELAPQ